MKKKVLLILLAISMLISLFPINALADSNFMGSGTQEDPYLIQSAEDLAALATLINEGDSPYSDAYFLQTADIDLSSYTNWKPIGNQSSDTSMFEGSYDGANYSISNLSIYEEFPDSIACFGLFGCVRGEIKNVSIDGGTIRVRSIYGVLPSENAYVGSVAGQFRGGTVENCSSSATIGVGTNSRDYYVYVGGIIGRVYDNTVIENCSYSGSMSVVNNYQSGGYIGGIVGTCFGATLTVRDCYNTGSIYGEGTGMRAAGIIGQSLGGENVIERCFNTGDVTSLTRGSYIYWLCGGIVSQSSSTNITDCFNLGTITAGDLDGPRTQGAGGIVGDFANSTIENCYNAGMVYADYCGGIGGKLNHVYATLIGCYYADTCEQTDYNGDFSANKCTLEQMKQQTIFEEFDFINTWEIIEGENYPVLQVLPFTYTTGISISQSTEELSVNETVQLSATVNTAEATGQSVVWISDDDRVATVDKTGLVTGKKVGTATITATTADGGFSETCDITVPGYSLDIYGNGSVIRFEDGEDAIINGSPSVTYSDIILICGSDVQLTLNDVNIDNSANADTPAVIFSGSGNQLILHGTSTLRGGENEPAVRVDEGAALEISGSGSLDAYGGANAAGIGSGTGNAGSITISDGQITSTGGENGAGIGSGTGNADSITISDGQITSTGGENGAGIGSGDRSDVTSIAISGGSVNAFGGYHGAGIGSGSAGTAESIEISGGTINAIGDMLSAGIGGGYYGRSTSITISDGVITADGNSAGIGGGYCGYCGLITINGGNIDAFLSERDNGYIGIGSGIGGGNACAVNTINITGGIIHAVGKRSSAGIGGSYGTRINTITISGGRISAFGGDGDSTDDAGAGIGTGDGWYIVDITISGGEIYACGGSDASSGYNVDVGIAGYPRGGAGFDLAPVEIIGDAVVFLEHDVCGIKDGPYTHTHMDVSDPYAQTIFGVTMDDDWTPTGAWILPITLEYDANGGQNAPNSVVQHINTDVIISDGGDMTKSEYDFAGWNTQADGLGNLYLAGGTITLSEDETLYALWNYVGPIPVSSVTLSSDSETMHVDDTVTLMATVLPADATYAEVTWSSSNTDVATVDQSGLVTAVGTGEATITATADGVSDTCVITVAPKPVNSVTLSSVTSPIYVGAKFTLTVEVLPDNATYPQVTWSSGNTDVVTVDQSGLVTTVGVGEATITATADGVFDTCVISVEEMYNDTIIDGKLNRTYYNGDGSINRVAIYYGLDSTGIYRIYYYEDGVETSYKEYDTSGNIISETYLYSNGVKKKTYWYSTTTGKRYAISYYNTGGKITHKKYLYSTGVTKRTYWYSTSTGKRYAISEYNTSGKITEKTYLYSNGVKKKTYWYSTTTGKKYAISEYNTSGKITQKTYLYSSGVKRKTYWYSTSTGKRYAISYYNTSGNITQKTYLYTSGVKKRNYWYSAETGKRYAISEYNTSGKITEKTYLYSNGVKRKTYWYSTSTGTRYAISYYGTNGKITHKKYLYTSGVTKKTYWYSKTTGKRYAISYYDTNGDITKKVYYNTDGSIKETIYY